MKNYLKSILSLLILVLTYTVNGQTVGDLTLSHTYTSSHIPSQCLTKVNVTYSITVNNSTLGDQLEVSFYSGRPDLILTNTTGASPWMIPNFEKDSINFADSDVIGTSLSRNLNAAIYQAKVGTDSIINPVFFQGGPLFTTTVPNPCTYFNVRGNVYEDLDASCSYSAGDLPYNFFYYVNYKTYPSFSTGSLASGAQNGIYITPTLPVDLIDSIEVYIPSFYQFIFPQVGCVKTSYMLSPANHTGKDFIFDCSSLSTDVVVEGFPSGAIRPFGNFTFNPMVGNLGCNVFSGVLKVVLDQNVTYNAGLSTHPADWVNGDTLFFNFTNYNNITGGGYWQSFTGGVNLQTSGSLNIGDSVCFEIISDYPVADINPLNNHVYHCFPVVNSFDPNSKEVTPKGSGPEGFIAKDNVKLRYRINFQNTGNAPAIDVALIDTLNAGVLIPSSLHIIDASHAMLPEWLNVNVIQFKFKDINLADSISNEPESHGYVIFEIDMMQGLAEGTEIKNKAAIYFDNNAPIITNFATNTIEITTLGISNLDNNELTLFPNPTSSKLQIRSKENMESVSISDLNGKLVFQSNDMNNHLFDIDLSNFGTGIYIVEIHANSTTYFRKVIKQ